MFDSTETACVLAGIAAAGAIYVAHSKSQEFVQMYPTECSARIGTVTDSFQGLSARAASTEEVTNGGGAFDGLFGLSAEGEESMQKSGAQTKTKMTPTQISHAMKNVIPQMALETTYSNLLGIKPLVAGRAGGDQQQKIKTTTNDSFLYDSEARANAAASQTY